MYVHVDATSYYSSVEKIFNPSLRTKPVIVSGNGDGVVIAVCPIAKRLGLKKFEPVFMQRDLIRKTGTVVQSANFELYGEVSRRMHTLLSSYGQYYAYSIDEGFCKVDVDQSVSDWGLFAASIRKRLWQELRIPTAVGVAPTLTLAKAANFCAKRIDGFRGIAAITNADERDWILERMDVEDIWGVGRRIGHRLKSVFNIRTALDFRQSSRESLHRAFSVNMARTHDELNFEPSLFWDDVRSPKKHIFSTRTISPIRTFDELVRVLIAHAMNVCRKARSQQSVIRQLVLFARPSSFQEGLRQGVFHAHVHFASPTDCYKRIANSVRQAIETHYQPGLDFSKVGVGAIALEHVTGSIRDLFDPIVDQPALSSVMDAIDERFGRGVISLASVMNTNASTYRVNRQQLSPRYLSCWTDIPRIKCN